MGWIRDFTLRHLEPVERNIDGDAPGAMRHELVDFFFHLAEQSTGQIQPRRIHDVTGLMLGVRIAGEPYGGYMVRVARDIDNAPWPRVYDWISRLWPEYERAGFGVLFREGVNTILAANGVVWELDDAGHLQRFLAEPLRQQIVVAIAQLGREHLTPARAIFDAATEAFNSRPRRDRDACANAYDALESVAKIAFNMPNATFGQVLDEARRRQYVNEHVLRLLRDVGVLGHNTFRHGMAEEFALSAAEVDFVYTVCAAGIPVFTR